METKLQKSFYDTILEKVKELFPKARIEAKQEDGSIIIIEKITLMLSLSGNEQKIYFKPFDFLPATNAELDVYHKLLRTTYLFRLFTIEAIFKYLELKKMENEFIRKNEG